MKRSGASRKRGGIVQAPPGRPEGTRLQTIPDQARAPDRPPRIPAPIR